MSEEFAIKEFNEGELTSERRRAQFNMRLRGFKRAEIREKLCEEYGVAPSTIDQDWQRRKDWLLEVVGLTDTIDLVTTTLGSFGLTQGFRKDIFETLLKLLPSKNDDDKFEDEDMEVLPAVWQMMMKLLNDIDAAEKTKSEIMTKLGILKEAPKKIEVNETKVEHKIDWTKLTEEMDEGARRKFFDMVGGIGQQPDQGGYNSPIDIESEPFDEEE